MTRFCEHGSHQSPYPKIQQRTHARILRKARVAKDRVSPAPCAFQPPKAGGHRAAISRDRLDAPLSRSRGCARSPGCPKSLLPYFPDSDTSFFWVSQDPGIRRSTGIELVRPYAPRNRREARAVRNRRADWRGQYGRSVSRSGPAQGREVLFVKTREK
jgi:hypothetical protein